MDDVTDEGLLDFIKTSKNLSYLDIGSNVSYSQKLILKIAEMRHDMGIRDPLTIAYNSNLRCMFPEERVSYKLSLCREINKFNCVCL